MKSKYGILAGFFVAAVVVGLVYYTGRHRKPLVYEFIPDVTVDWVKELSQFDNVHIGIVDRGPFNWDNADDPGQATETDWQKVDADPNFIVYYKNDPMHLNVQNARRVLEIANQAIPEIQDLMGRYAFPEDCNGRRLSIYVASSAADYQSTIDMLYGAHKSSSGSAGMFICHVGPLGCLADGIVLNPVCFDYESSPLNWAETVLRHEMNHYAYYTSVNFGKEIRHPLWVQEGLAEFASKHVPQIMGRDSIDYISTRCKVSEEFPTEMNAQYWAGLSFYNFVSKVKGSLGIRAFIRRLYENDIDGTLALTFGDSVAVDSLWVAELLSGTAPVDSLAEIPARQ